METRQKIAPIHRKEKDWFKELYKRQKMSQRHQTMSQ